MSLNFVMQQSIQFFFKMIASLQMVLQTAIMNINYPGNVITQFSIIIPFAMFDLFESFEWIPKVPLEFSDVGLELMKEQIHG